MHQTSTVSTTTTITNPGATSSRVVTVIDYLYEEWVVHMALAVIVGYLAPFGEWRAYLVVPFALLVVPTLVASLLLYCHRGGLFVWIRALITARIDALTPLAVTGVTKIRDSKLGQFLLGLALVNSVFFTGYAAWFNIDLLRFLRAFAEMLVACVTALRDPIALLKAFTGLLRSLAMLEVMDELRDRYVMRIVGHLEHGEIGILLAVGAASFSLVLIALCFYLLCDEWCVTKEEEEEEEEAGEKQRKKL